METQEHNKISIDTPLIEKDLHVGDIQRDGALILSVVERKEIVEEVKKQLWLAGPLICVSLLQFCLQLISLMFVGHLGELVLAGAAMATSFATVTGFSLLMGMSSALDTLCGQSYGAKQYHMLGIYLQRAVIVLLCVSIPLAFIWANTGFILQALGQDPEIAEQAGIYARSMIPTLFGYGFLQCLVRFLQTQNNVFPMMLTSGVSALFHILLCWLLVYKVGLGSPGAAIANSISYWVNCLLLALYIKFSSDFSNTWKGFSKEAFQNIPTFMRLAIPSAVMVCLEMWSFEMMVLLAGLLPNPQLETSVLSICLSTAGTIWMIPFGLSSAVSTRVSNELGAGRPQIARLAVCVVLVMAITEGLLVGVVLLLIRNVWGRAYSNETEIIKYVATMMPLLATSNFMDGLQCVLSGTVRGCGFQKIGAYINLGSYYLVGIPTAIFLAFVVHFGGKGLWTGIICALCVQVTSFLTIIVRTNWVDEARKAKERVYDSSVPVEILS
ncbi:transporter [Lithospermum erythrorhizon]|uniref:Protein DETOXIFICATION n=1 Tax=Lithospermum erythrorhizon TaxID=34254 RepID=A0AAV3S236_LITER